MLKINRRGLFAAGRTLIAAALLGKLEGAARAEDLLDFSHLQMLSPPTPAPDVSFLRTDGSALSLNAARGKGVVLNFWATWCPPCVAELPSLDRLAGTLAGSGIELWTVSEDLGENAAAKVRKFYDAHGIAHLPVLVDPHGQAADAFGNQGVPTTLLIDQAGMVRARFEGGTDWGEAAVAAKVRGLVG
jgi:peroxiredoxin